MTERFSNFSEQKIKDLRYHLGLLDDQVNKFGTIKDGGSQECDCIKEIEDLAKALMENFRLEYDRIVNYAVHMAPARKDALKMALSKNESPIKKNP